MKENMKEMVGGCCVCSDERGWPDNPLVYCDGNGCTVAVHQACYGIIAVPTGPWFCRKCECPDIKGKVRCELCPSKSGALKRTDTGGWAHVVCALYIPEVRFGNVTSMEPIVLRLIPPERFNKTCYICQELGKNHRANAGACMQCNKSGCKQQFHVTCAQSLGLLCEEAGNYLDNVKYCGYCQHHYSKLKKGGNVKTIPPYKPVAGHDSQSSDSSEREGDGSPTHSNSNSTSTSTSNSNSNSNSKAKGPGRKTSHTNSGAPCTKTVMNKTPTNNPVLDKKKPSPSRRASLAGATEPGCSSKTSTPAPSPQHNTENSNQSGKGSASTRSLDAMENAAKIPLPSSSPKQPEMGGVISSISSIPIPPSPTTPTAAVPTPPKYQETVITNTEAVDTKQTKKRKAVAAMAVDYAPAETVVPSEPPAPVQPSTSWEPSHIQQDIPMESVEKVIKKAKTDGSETTPQPQHFACLSPVPPPPPPAHSPASQPSPRHLPSPMPGPSGINQVSNIRSPSQPQCARERSSPASLLVSVPLPPAGHGLGLGLGAHTQIPPPDMGPSPHIFHQPIKQSAMEPGVSVHSPHGVGRSAWAGLNVAYEMQDPNKPGVSGVAGPSKDANVGANLGPIPPAIRNKKRAAMATSVVSMANANNMQTAMQNLASVRRPPQPTPPPIYQETIKDSPPSSPSSERPLKPKIEPRCSASTAPHMLGNELNPESGAAARLQEQLSAELAAHAAGTSSGSDVLVPPPLINKAAPGTSSGSRGSSAQSLDQLLERQWEQGSQFLMEQAQHFDMGDGTARPVPYKCSVASLLSCLHQLRTENVRLEEHVGNLLQRRDHLLAVNARLAIPLTAVVTGPGEPSRCPRENGASVRGPGPVRPNETITSDRPHQLIMREVQQKPS